MNIKLLREYVKRVLAESVCPGCGNKDAYIGINAVECPNASCSFFSKRQQDDIQAVGADDEDGDYEECGWCDNDISGCGGHCEKCGDGDIDMLQALDDEANKALDDEANKVSYEHCGMCGLKAVDPDTQKCTNCSNGHFPDCAGCGGAVDNPTACQNCGHPS